MADPKPCPECGGKTWNQEISEYALLEAMGGVLTLHTDKANTRAVVAKVYVCGGCGFIKLFEA